MRGIASDSALSGLALLVATAICYGAYCGYRTRRVFKRLEHQGIPIMRHSWLLGHLAVIGKLLSNVPSDAHGDYMMMMILEHWRDLFPGCTKCPVVAYIDLWPFAPPTMICLHHDVSVQFTQDHNLPKAHQQKGTLYCLTANRDLSSMEGPEWKLWRKRLNPGFSIQNITSRIPDIMEEVQDFAATVEHHAGKDGEWGDVFQLEHATTGLALDVILRFVLNKRFHEQTNGRSPLSIALLDTISRMFFFINIFNYLSYISPWRRYKLWNNYRVMKGTLLPEIKTRAAEIQSDRRASNKTLVDLICKSIDEEKDGSDTVVPSALFDEPFLETAVGNILTFLFAGHDTTAFTLCCLFHVLAQHPEVLAKVRAEHDAILGRDQSHVADILKRDPSLLNSLSYTHAVLKETMRVHSNVGTMRRGEPGFFLVGPSDACPEMASKQLPTEDFVIWDGTFAIHHNPDVWHRPSEFIPERFMTTDESDPLHPRKDAWRFFEMGPRNCIGQHLALVEIKMALALVVRQYDIETDYSGWDKQTNNKSQLQVWGDRFYQVGTNSPPHAKDSMPVRVRIHTA